MARNLRPANIAADAIERGTMFGFWRVEDPEIVRRTPQPNENLHKSPRPAFVLCHCTRCDKTTKLVRLTYLLTGKSTSCCRRARAAPAPPVCDKVA